MNFINILYKSENIRKVIPAWLTSFIRKHFRVLAYDRHKWAQSDSFRNLPPESTYPVSHPFTLGIIKEFTHDHCHYVAACREMGVKYKLLDISVSNWIDVINKSECDAFLVRPSAVLTIWKQMYDERLRIMTEDLGKLIYPSYKELWIYESKRKTRDWLQAYNIPHPKTEIFYELDQALDFVNQSNYPLIMKMNLGASSHGVHILRDKKAAEKIVNKIFKKGIVIDRGDPRDVQWGSVILQEYLQDAKEWRMVRIGGSFFGHPKGKVGDFHSGSGKVLWEKPPSTLLNFLRSVTDTGNFTSMCVDIFETTDGQYLVNELQTVFGTSHSKDQLRIKGKTGRFILSNNKKDWIFEPGDFARNACANLRVECLLEQLYDYNKSLK